MRKTVIAALAIVAMVGCSKEDSANELIDTTDQVAATFSAATITRVADNAWETGNQIGISMTNNGLTTLASGNYENVPYTVDDINTGTFKAGTTVIYYPVDETETVDFYAYYPHSTVDANNDIAVSVATQTYEHIDLIAAKVTDKTKDSPEVSFTGDAAFKHKLSKLSLTIEAGDGIASLSGLETTIKGQYTTAKFNIYSFGISGEDGNTVDIEPTTTLDADNKTANTSAILIPTAAVSGSSVVFTLDGNDYVWDTSAIALEQGYEYNYTIKISKIGITVSGATISGWDDGVEEDSTIDVTPKL
ncbi:MAG: fimbrillin family protein [Rikenellaceae bacterium]